MNGKRESAGLFKKKNIFGGWSLMEIDVHGNATPLTSTRTDFTVSNGNGVSIIIYEDGRKEMYDFSKGFRTGHIRSI